MLSCITGKYRNLVVNNRKEKKAFKFYGWYILGLGSGEVYNGHIAFYDPRLCIHSYASSPIDMVRAAELLITLLASREDPSGGECWGALD